MYGRLSISMLWTRRCGKVFKEVNPHALQNIAEKQLEAIERGMWDSLRGDMNEGCGAIPWS